MQENSSGSGIETSAVRHVAEDEKSFGNGHDFLSIIADLDARRVLDIAKVRTIQVADSLSQTLDENQRLEVESVLVDMWQAFTTSAKKNAPEAEIAHDRFHISKYLEAVDRVRREEHRKL